MNRVIIFNYSRPDIGMYTRATTYGDEHTLVEQFIDYYCTRFLRYNKEMWLAVFIEPRMDSGYPDVIFATYRPSILENWSCEREKLDVFDLKLLSYLFDAKASSGQTIISMLGVPEKKTQNSLEKLMDAKLLSYQSGDWRVRELRDVFNITKLVAVEAKVSAISRVVDQSLINTRFASHSYSLTNSANPKNETIETFSRLGIGLYCKSAVFRKYLEAKEFPLPSSYVSFQFNEWIARAITH